MFVSMMIASAIATSQPNVVNFRTSAAHTLVAINSTFGEVRGILGINRDEFEAIYSDKVELWARGEDISKLKAAGIAAMPTIDVAAESFKAEKARNYMDKAGSSEEPRWDEYCGYTCMTTRLAEMSAEGGCVFPFELENIGKTGQGRDIWVAKVGSRGPNVLMAGNIHGDETTGGQILQRWLWNTCNNPSNAQTQVATSVTAYYMPMFNPDGYEMNQRGNANGADLNRAFPAVTGGGSTTQPEAIAYVAWRRTVTFDVGIMFHGGAVVCNYAYDACYTSSIVPRPCPPASTSYHKRDAEVIPSSESYCNALVTKGVRCSVGTNCQVNGAAWYQIEGSLQDWDFHFQNTLAMTMEISSQKRPQARLLPGYWTDHEKSIEDFMMWSATSSSAASAHTEQ